MLCVHWKHASPSRWHLPNCTQGVSFQTWFHRAHLKPRDKIRKGHLSVFHLNWLPCVSRHSFNAATKYVCITTKYYTFSALLMHKYHACYLKKKLHINEVKNETKNHSWTLPSEITSYFGYQLSRHIFNIHIEISTIFLNGFFVNIFLYQKDMCHNTRWLVLPVLKQVTLFN